MKRSRAASPRLPFRAAALSAGLFTAGLLGAGCTDGDISLEPPVIPPTPDPGPGAATADVLVTDSPSDELSSFRAVVTEVRLELAGGGVTQNLLPAPVGVEFLGLQGVFAFLSSAAVSAGTYDGARIAFEPGSYEARDAFGDPVAVDAAGDVLIVALEPPLVLDDQGYGRAEVDFDLVESLSGAVAMPPIALEPEGTGAGVGAGGLTAVDELFGVVTLTDPGDSRFAIDATADDDLAVPVRSLTVELLPGALLRDLGGTEFPSEDAFFAALIEDLSVVEVLGDLGEDGVLLAQRVEIEDQAAGAGLLGRVKLEGRVMGLSGSSFDLLVQEVEQGGELALPILGGDFTVAVSTDGATSFLRDGILPGSFADLAVGQRVEVKFASFVAEPFPAERVVLGEARFAGVVVGALGPPGGFAVNLLPGDPAVLAGLVDSAATDVGVVVGAAPIFLDSAGQPPVAPVQLQPGVQVVVAGELTGPSSGPTLTASSVRVRAGRFRGEVTATAPLIPSFVADALSIEDPFGGGVSAGPVDTLLPPTAVFQGDAADANELFALFDALALNESIEVEVEGLASLFPNQVDGFEVETRLSVIPPPVVDFEGMPMMPDGTIEGTLPFGVSFTDLTTGKTTSFEWDFGDGGNSMVQNPLHTYLVAGVYPVTLTVIGPGGKGVETKLDYVTVNERPPVAAFSANPTMGEFPLLVTFTANPNLGGPITDYEWDFDDGSSNSLVGPVTQHQYLTSGLFSPTLTVTGPGGMDSLTLMDLIDVDAPPVNVMISANPTSGDAPLVVQFMDESTAGVGDTIDSWTWTFGDGKSSNLQNPMNTYDDPGTYDVTLTVGTSMGGGGMMTFDDFITVTAPPVPPTFTEIFDLLDAEGCDSCHTTTLAERPGDHPGSDVILTPKGTAFTSLTTTAPACNTFSNFVVANNVGSSYLIQKIESGSPSCGVQMPLGGTPLTNEQIQMIKDWINDGAPNN